MSKFAVIDASRKVVNVVEFEAGAAWLPPEGCISVQSDTACIAWTYANGVFVPPPVPAPTSQQIHAALVASAQAAIDKSDTTILRCVSASVAVPAEWQTYRAALRAIVGGTDTTSTMLPATPAFPAGT